MNARTVTDASGQVLVVPDSPVRIVSLVPSLTELLIDLGLREVLVGRTGFCIHPAEVVRNIAKVGGTKDLKLRTLLALEPTHVVMNIDENRREDAERLQAAGVSVVVTHPQTPHDNVALYRLLGQLFGASDAATQLEQRLASALAYASACRQQHSAPLSVLYLIWREPWMTVSAPTYVGQMLQLAGLGVLEQSDTARYPCVDEDAWTRADRVLLASEPFAFRARHRDEIATRFHVDAANIRFVDGELLSWYGSRAIDGVRYAATLASTLAKPAPAKSALAKPDAPI